MGGRWGKERGVRGESLFQSGAGVCWRPSSGVRLSLELLFFGGERGPLWATGDAPHMVQAGARDQLEGRETDRVRGSLVLGAVGGGWGRLFDLECKSIISGTF